MTWCGRPIRKASKSRSSPTPPLRRVGASSASLSALHRVRCLAVRRILLRPVRSQLLVCLCPVCSKLRNRLPYRNSLSSDPAPAYLRQAVPATTVTPAPPGPTQPSPSAAPDPVPLSAPAAAGASGVPSEPCFPHMPARSPTVPSSPGVVDPPSGVRLRPRHPRRHGIRRRYPNGILCDRQCDNPACMALCPREDDPLRGTRHRHHACDNCHALGW